MEVTAGFHYIKEDTFCSEDESNIIAIQHFEIGEHWIPVDAATLKNDGPFLTLTLESSENELQYPYMQHARTEIQKLRDELTPDDWLEGTTDETLILPISVLRWQELSLVA